MRNAPAQKKIEKTNGKTALLAARSIYERAETPTGVGGGDETSGETHI